jgi:hypothetical protein
VLQIASETGQLRGYILTANLHVIAHKDARRKKSWARRAFMENKGSFRPYLARKATLERFEWELSSAFDIGQIARDKLAQTLLPPLALWRIKNKNKRLSRFRISMENRSASLAFCASQGHIVATRQCFCRRCPPWAFPP